MPSGRTSPSDGALPPSSDAPHAITGFRYLSTASTPKFSSSTAKNQTRWRERVLAF